jgi:hypothetical protein
MISPTDLLPTLNTPYVTSAGYMQIRFHSDYGKVKSGFLGTWNALFQPECYTCPANTYSSGLGDITSCHCEAGFTRTEGGGCAYTPGEYLNTPIPTCLSTNAISTCCTGGMVSTSANSGTISQGTEALYSIDIDCTWTIGPSSAISFQFSRMDVEERYDAVALLTCTDALCTSPVSTYVFWGEGFNLPSPYTQLPSFNSAYSTTSGYMQIRFLSDHDKVHSGFLGT